MTPVVTGLLRSTLAAAAGVGIVLGATHVRGDLAVAPTTPPALGTRADSQAVDQAVTGASVVCPGPELSGVAGVGDIDVAPRLAAAAAPSRVLTGVTPAATPGTLAATGLPGRTVLKPQADRGTTALADLAGSGAAAGGALVTATQSMASGLAAAQSWLVPSGDHRALASAGCAPATAESWILAGGGAAGRQERLVLTNPGGNPVTVDVTLHGPAGAVPTPQGKGLVVPARGRTVFLLDSISGDLTTPAVHVVAQGGVVSAVVNDLWLDGTRSAGSDDAVPAAAPSREQVVPAVLVNGAAVLRVLVPGDNEAVVQARVLTPRGPRALPTGGVTRVDGGRVRDIDITKLPKDAVALQVRADVPVVAAAMVTRGSAPRPSDLAWTSSTPAITGVAGTPLAEPPRAAHRLSRQLVLTSTGGACGVEVVTVDTRGRLASVRLDVAADSTTSLDAGRLSSVWVHRTSGTGQLRAGVVSSVSDSEGTLITAQPLHDTALRTTTVGLREAQP
ncbi:DUF5719 family protein [Pedococcus sp. KACC 23699]|uniref:DUF5719 family protein n=1 Tax=Pedococcus sp. KACC 23699 TaxID=3149228 RepID=A0AAU7JV97_9MICO